MKLHQVDEILEVSVSKLRSSTFDDVDMADCLFHNANMTNWNVTDANLRDGRITNADMTNFAIRDVKLDGMTIDGILVADLFDVFGKRL